MDIFISIIICFLAVYGVFRLIYGIALFLSDGKKFKPKLRHEVVVVDDSSKDVEAYVRSIAMREEGQSLVIINRCQSEEMQQLLQIICGEFGFVAVMTDEEYTEYIKSSA